jgi:hypothetical protein
MRSAVLLTVIAMTFSQPSLILAQEARVLTPVLFREGVNSSQSLLPFAVADQLLSRTTEPVAVPHHRGKASARRLLIGALIGGAAGAALGYKLGSKCVFAPREECVADGQLTSGVFGGLGAVIGISLAGATR